MTLDQIRASIEARIAELEKETAALEAARAVLKSPTEAARSASAGRARKPRRRRAPAGGTPETGGTPEIASRPAAENGVSPGPAAGARPKAARASRKRPQSITRATVEAMLGEVEDGLSAAAISKSTAASYARVSAMLRELGSQGKVRRTGTRRTSLWRLITDEERIAERAAELERLSRKPS